MARFIHFSDIYLDKYDNERFANYITTLLAKIEDVGAKELGVEAYFEEFSTLVNLYMDLFVVPRRFLQTPELKKIEIERTLCMQHIYNVIEIEAKNSFTDHQEAAKVLLIVAKDLRHVRHPPVRALSRVHRIHQRPHEGVQHKLQAEPLAEEALEKGKRSR